MPQSVRRGGRSLESRRSNLRDRVANTQVGPSAAPAGAGVGITGPFVLPTAKSAPRDRLAPRAKEHARGWRSDRAHAEEEEELAALGLGGWDDLSAEQLQEEEELAAGERPGRAPGGDQVSASGLSIRPRTRPSRREEEPGEAAQRRRAKAAPRVTWWDGGERPPKGRRALPVGASGEEDRARDADTEDRALSQGRLWALLEKADETCAVEEPHPRRGAGVEQVKRETAGALEPHVPVVVSFAAGSARWKWEVKKLIEGATSPAQSRAVEALISSRRPIEATIAFAAPPPRVVPRGSVAWWQ
jgi:hypothetical protein